MLNYFSVNGGEFYLVDLPGYGYAKVADKERDSWKGLIEFYLQKSERLKFVFLVVDVRREPTDLDLQLAAYFDYYAIPYVLVATKADKLSKSACREAVAAIAKGFNKAPETILLVSSLTGVGRDAVLAAISERI